MSAANEAWREAWDKKIQFYRELADGPQTPAPCSLSATPAHDSLAMAVHPSQAQELREYCQSMGVPTEVKPDGTPVVQSRAHGKALAKIRGLRNRGEV